MAQETALKKLLRWFQYVNNYRFRPIPSLCGCRNTLGTHVIQMLSGKTSLRAQISWKYILYYSNCLYVRKWSYTVKNWALPVSHLKIPFLNLGVAYLYLKPQHGNIQLTHWFIIFIYQINYSFFLLLDYSCWSFMGIVWENFFWNYWVYPWKVLLLSVSISG